MRQVDIRWERRFTSGHHNYHHNPVVTYRGRQYELEHGAGSGDLVYAYMEGTRVYVLTINTQLPYAGLDEYDLAQDAEPVQDSESGTIHVWKPVGDVFAQEHQAYDMIGPKGVDYTPRTILRRLIEYLPY